MIGIQFSRLAQEFWHIDDTIHRKSTSAAGAFWEQ
jgi:hypothetical protein